MKVACLFLCAALTQVPLTAAADAPSEDLQAYRYGVAHARAVAKLLRFENPSNLSFRFTPSPVALEPIEYSVSFVLQHPSSTVEETDPAPLLRAVLRVPEQPIRQQISQLLDANPGLPIEEMVRRVAVQRYDLFEERCPAVRSAREKFVPSSAAALVIDREQEGAPRTWMDGATIQIEGIADEVF